MAQLPPNNLRTTPRFQLNAGHPLIITTSETERARVACAGRAGRFKTAAALNHRQ